MQAALLERLGLWPDTGLRTLATLIVFAAALGSPPISAEPAADGSLSRWRVGGYGNLARSWDNHHELAPIRDVSQHADGGFAGGPTWKLDSRLALHAAYRASSELEFVGQIVARHQADRSLPGAIELAYGEWFATDKLSLRAGRFGYDAFLMSDHRNLGYAYDRMRPPTEFYGWVPLYSIDGIDIATDWKKADGHWRLRAQLGQNRTESPTGDDEYEFRTDYIWALTLSREAGPWRMKAGWSAFRIGSEAKVLTPLHAGLEAVAAATAAGFPDISAEASALRQATSFRDTRINYLTVGLAYDDGAWLVQSEYGQSRATHAIAPAGDMAYLSVGRRLSDWTPFAGYSVSKPGEAPLAGSADWSAIGQSALQSQAVFIANSSRIDQSTFTLGLRWDFHSQAAFKLQWDRTRINPQGYGVWFRSPESNNQANWVSLVSAGVDFIF